MNCETAQPSHGFTSVASDVGSEVELILYKVILTKKTGSLKNSNNQNNLSYYY